MYGFASSIDRDRTNDESRLTTRPSWSCSKPRAPRVRGADGAEVAEVTGAAAAPAAGVAVLGTATLTEWSQATIATGVKRIKECMCWY